MCEANSTSVAKCVILAKKAGLTAGDLARCSTKGINTIHNFASAASVSQGQSDKAAMVELTAKVLGLGVEPANGWGDAAMNAIEADLHKVRLLVSQ